MQDPEDDERDRQQRDAAVIDAGQLRASTGVALLWRAPVGPISISYAFPLKKEDGDELERLQLVAAELGKTASI